MKIKVSGLAGIIIAALLAVSYLLPPQYDKTASGEAPANTWTEAGANRSGPETNRSEPKTTGKKDEAPSKSAPSGEPSSNATAESAAAAGPIVIPDTEGIVPGGYIHAKVTNIVDGDTIKAEYNGKEYKVRLLCIDTPETVKGGVPVQPYGKQASEKLKEMLLDKEVTLVFEKDIDDRYGRLLAYVFLEDGTCINALMVEQGYARIEIVRPNALHKDFFTSLQEKAIKEKRGLWSLPEGKRPFVKNEKGYYVPRYSNKAA